MSNHQFNQHAGNYEQSGVQDDASNYIRDMLSRVPVTSGERCIFTVPHHLREVNKKAYEPEILAIGPYHYGNGKLKFMEEQKLRYVQQLLQRRNEVSVDRCVLALRELEQQARNCYAEPMDLSQKDFLAMMFIDGCFIVELFHTYDMGELGDEDKWRRHPSLWRDLLLLENQLPLFVLSKLYDLTKGPGDHREFIDVATKCFHSELEGPSQNGMIGNSEHLLHQYHTWLTSELPEKSMPIYFKFMSSATELRDSGVRFRAAQGRNLIDIKFENGTLEIPCLTVQDSTESEYRNLVAYEQHRQSGDINYFTDYVKFMDCLINSSKDVKVLRRAGIIENYLGDDEVVAQMFNRIGDHVVLSISYYSEIFQNVNAHCKKYRNRQMAKLMREYLHSPWAVLSILVGIVFLLLTAAQTVFTILSYTKQS